MAVLACVQCGTKLTLDCTWGRDEQRDLSVGDRQSPVPRGVLIRLAADSVPVCERDGQMRTHLYSPEGAIAANPADVIPQVLLSSGIDVGCCGSDGCDGPNRSCRCGNVVATEWSDCWTFAEIRFLPGAVSAEP